MKSVPGVFQHWADNQHVHQVTLHILAGVLSLMFLAAIAALYMTIV
jgi:hypothetical protein